MSRLENLSKPVLKPLILQPNKRRVLTLDDQAALVAWCAKMGIVFEHTVPRDRQRFYSAGEHRVFRDTLTPADGVYIWLAQYRGIRRSHSTIRNYNLRRRVDPDPRHLQAITVSVQHFVLQVVAGRWHETAGIEFDSRDRAQWTNVAARLWPSNHAEIQWPPPVSLTDQTLERFADRWSSGVAHRRY